MRYTQLRAFHHVACQGGFSRAAEHLNQSQPSLSEQVRQLERDQDVLLFVRRNRKIVLTEAGERLLELTRQFFEVEDTIGEFLDQSRHALHGTLRVMVDSPAHISDMLHAFRRQHPQVVVEMRTGNSLDVLNALRNYESEIGVFGRVTDEADLVSIPLGTSPIRAVSGLHFFDAMPDYLSFAEMKELPLIFRERGSQTLTRVLAAARKAGIRLEPAMVVEGREAMRDMVAQGFGIGFVSEAEIDGDTRLHQINLEGGALEMPETLAHLKSRGHVPIIRAFMAALSP
jgi:aminoethylphosphonate catabolism LysR family transcriptional regulator